VSDQSVQAALLRRLLDVLLEIEEAVTAVVDELEDLLDVDD
jgi:hypothetical protein